MIGQKSKKNIEQQRRRQHQQLRTKMKQSETIVTEIWRQCRDKN